MSRPPELEQTREIVLKLHNFCLELIKMLANGDKAKEESLIKQLIDYMLKPLDKEIEDCEQ